MNRIFSNPAKTLAAVSMLLAGITVSAAPAAAQATPHTQHCTAIVNAVIEGSNNIAKTDINSCAEFGLRVSGDGHGTDVSIDGQNWVSIGQIGYGTSVYLDVAGYGNEIGALNANGARLKAFINGDRNKIAGYLQCDEAKFKVDGNGNTIIVKGKC